MSDAAGRRPAGRDRRGASATAASTRERWLRWLAPLAIAALALGAWELVVRVNADPALHPARPAAWSPTAWSPTGARLWPSLLVTLQITLMALAAAIVGGVGLAVLFSLSRWIELSLFPFAVILQVTPIVAIAPLILIYVDNTYLALLICAWIVAFFPILSNTTLGPEQRRPQSARPVPALRRHALAAALRLLRLPAAMPYFLGGLKIAGGLSLIGAIVAEFAAGTAGTGSGLAYRILEAGYRLNIPRMFAALILISLTGIVDLPGLHPALAPASCAAGTRAPCGGKTESAADVAPPAPRGRGAHSRRSERSAMPSSSRWAVVLNR